MKISKTYKSGFWIINILMVILMLLASCSTTRYLGEDEYLLNKVVVDVNNPEVDKEELKSYLRIKENTRILGFFKFHLWLYNLSSKEKPDGWLKRTGEAPQVYDPVVADQSKSQIMQYLHNKGYYSAQVDMNAHENVDRQKVNLKYSIQTGNVYRIGKVDNQINDPGFKRLFEEEYSSQALSTGNRFDLEMLDSERDRITQFYRNRGYYYFNKSMLYFDADTLGHGSVADLVLRVETGSENSMDSVRIFSPWYVKDIHWSVMTENREFQSIEGLNSDTITSGSNHFIFRDEFPYHTRLFERLNRLQPDSLYHLGKAEDTFTALNRLRQFRFINIYFQENRQKADTAWLNGYIDLAPLPRQAVTFDLEGTNTSGNLGVASNVNYMHRNLFRGAEIMSLKLKGAMERQQAVVSEQSLDFNTREIGLEANMSVPKLLGPANLFHSFGNVLPKTLISFGYNFQQRPDYTRTISSVKLGYEWMTSAYTRHNWDILDFNLVNLSRFDPAFLNSIYDLYIKSSFTDHLIFGTTYVFTHNTQEIRSRGNYYYLRFSAESSGNLLYSLSLLTGAKKTMEADSTGLRPQEYYTLLDSRYAQFLKGDIEIRRGVMIDRYNSVVGRFFAGVGLPYGNFDVLPFEKKYFTGGANGIRAWQVRSLGPGTFKAPPRSYPNQSGDIKLEANLEYRFRLIRYLESAFFLDVGNIWAINEKDNRPGAQFRLGSFYKQFAVGTGTGIRLDFDYFIFRLDLGLKLRDPAQMENGGWIPGSRKLKGDDFNLSFAIGYPF